MSGTECRRNTVPMKRLPKLGTGGLTMAEKETKSCSDCIHFDVCYKIEHFGRDLEGTSPCEQFINKDVAPVRHGHWVKEKSDVLIHWHCSVCKNCYYLDEPNANYCPNCGAKNGRG